MEYLALKSQITDCFSEMSPQVQMAARYVIDNPDDVALLSMRQLAKAAGVHPTTMVRLGQALGFEGFNEMRDVFQNRMRVMPEDLVGRARGLQGQKDQTSSILSEIEDNVRQNVRQSFHGCGAQTMEAAADLLLGAKRVFVMGLRISYPVAFSFHYAYSMFRTNALLMDGRAGTVADALRGIGKGDVLLAISVSPYSRESVQAVKYARSKGAEVISLSDSEITPISGNINLVAKNESLTFFPSVTASMALAESLIAIMIAKGGEDLLNVVAQSKAQLDEFEAYWEVQNEPASALCAPNSVFEYSKSK